jgi:hypothetical protein
MSKRWTAWPPGIRWLVGIAAVALVAAIVWALFVPLADCLARHDVGPAKPALLQTARDATRGRLLTLVAGLFAASALVFTALNFTLSRRTFELTEQGQVTDRYTKAIEQLGSGKLDVRIGGIYAVERVARDSAKDQPTAIEVLTAFVREHSREPWPSSDTGDEGQERLTRVALHSDPGAQPRHIPGFAGVPASRTRTARITTFCSSRGAPVPLLERPAPQRRHPPGPLHDRPHLRVGALARRLDVHDRNAAIGTGQLVGAAFGDWCTGRRRPDRRDLSPRQPDRCVPGSPWSPRARVTGCGIRRGGAPSSWADRLRRGPWARGPGSRSSP